MIVLFIMALLIIMNIQQRRQIKRLELLPPEVHQENILKHIADLRVENDSLGILVLKHQDSALNLAAKMNQAETKAQLLEAKHKNATEQYKLALKYCKEIKQVDAHQINELKLIQTNCGLYDKNVDELVAIHKEYKANCKKGKRRSFAVGFGAGLLLGLLIP